MHVKNTIYQHQNFSAPAFNLALQKAKYRVLAQQGGGTAVGSYYEVPRVVAIE